MSMSYFDDIQESAKFIREKFPQLPDLAIVLGTGMGALEGRLKPIREISYRLIPSFVPTTVESHVGKMVLASWAGREVLLLSGRLHYYEGYSLQEVTFPIRVLAALGIRNIWFTNASGSVNPAFGAGDLVFIEDHINFHPENPLRGIYDARLGPRFPDMSQVYDREWLEKASGVCSELEMPFRSGVYFGLQGPSLETAAEYRMIRTLGGDIVGMSTVPEVIVAQQSGMRIMAASVVSNHVHGYAPSEKTTLESVLAVISQSSAKLFDVYEKMLGII
jgi:purine-nucleoside phosphorylase